MVRSVRCKCGGVSGEECQKYSKNHTPTTNRNSKDYDTDETEQKHNIPEYQNSDDKEEAVPLQQVLVVSQVLVVTLRQVWMVVTLLQVMHVPLGSLLSCLWVQSQSRVLRMRGPVQRETSLQQKRPRKRQKETKYVKGDLEYVKRSM